MDANYRYFMKADLRKYKDEWIAIVGAKIVAHGKSVQTVISEAERKHPGKKPLLAKVPGRHTMIL